MRFQFKRCAESQQGGAVHVANNYIHYEVLIQREEAVESGEEVRLMGGRTRRPPANSSMPAN